MLPIRPPSTSPQPPLRHDPTATSTQARPSSQVVPEPLPTSVSVGNITFHTGEVKTPLSELEKRILCFALHSQTPKELGEIDEKNHLFTYAFGPNDYFPDRHLPRNLNLPEKMQAICALDPSLNRLNLRRVIITDLKNPEHVLCDASYELPITDGSTVRPAFIPPAPLEPASQDASTARAQFATVARGGSLAAAAPVSGAPEPRATQKWVTVADAQIREHLMDPHGTVRTRLEVVDALHAAGLEPDQRRLNALLRTARGEPHRPPSSDAQIREHLMDPLGTVRTRLEVVDALHAAGLGANPKRISERLVDARGPLHRMSATNAQIWEQLKKPVDAWRTMREVVDALHDARLGATKSRIYEQLRIAKKLQQRAVTGSQAGEE